MGATTSVIILAGGSLKSKFDYIKVSSECPALLPVNCKSITSYIISFYANRPQCKVYLATNKKYEAEIRQELNTFDFNIEFIFMPETDDVISSLQYSVKQLDPLTEMVIVNLVTTIPTVFPGKNDIQISDRAEISKLWSGYLPGRGFIFKKNNPGNIPFYAFTGIFCLEKSRLVTFLSRENIDRSDLFSLFNEEDLATFNIRMGDWLDCGHEVNYYETKTKLISSRTFNNITFVQRGIIRKSSDNADKLKDEAAYYGMLPADVSILFPRLLKEYYKSEEKGVYELEFYGYPNVAELILFWDLSYDVLRRMFSHFNEILAHLKSHPGSISREDYVDFYKSKLNSRVREYLSSLDQEHAAILNDELIVNGVKCLPFYKLTDLIDKKFECLYNEKDICIMHGDFCYNNILYDVPTGITKLIDPRGSFSEKSKGIFGDHKYDLAKLAHSAIGGYDFFVNNKYNMAYNGRSFDYSFGNSKHLITTSLMEELIHKSGYELNDIKFIMGTLFLSMCPLHSDSPKRQMTFYVHGLKILTEVMVPGK